MRIANGTGWARGAKIGAALLAGLGATTVAPHVVAAHFFLEEPASWRAQTEVGDPQKVGPCGNEGAAAETSAITAYRSGETITITLRETIYHPGHFRVALAVDDRSELPAPPPVTEGSTDCGSVPIMDPPVFPVLADGVLPHTSPLSGEQTIEVTLPEGVTCDHCTLQIVQWMASHRAPCFYYHCADISIAEVEVDAGEDVDAGARVDAGSSGADASTPMDAGTGRMDAGEEGPPTSSCGCAAPGRAGSATGAGAGALLAIALVVRRRLRA